MLDHVGVPVADVAKARRFYETALAPLEARLVTTVPNSEGGDAHRFGRDGKPAFWIGETDRPMAPLHVAFAATSRAAVDAFHAAAITAGGRSNGAPGLRPRYHPDYYAAFVLDLDGNNVEAVCHAAG